MAKQQEVHSGGAICGDLLTPFKRVDIGSKYYLISQLSFTAEQDAYDIELTLAEDLSSTPTPGDVVRSSVLPTHTTAGAAQAATEGARRLMLQNTSGIADLSTSVDTKLTQIELDDLTDVDTTTRTPVDGDVLEWVDTTGEWQPATPSGGGGGVTSVTGTTPIASTGGTTPAISIAAATTGAAGSMSAADKTKLDGVATGAVSFPSEHCLWKGAATSGTAGSNTLSLSVTGNYVSWSTLKAYYTVDVDTGTNTDADKVYTIPTTGLYEFNTLAVFINTAGTDGTICKIILAINRDGSPADLCTRATIEIPAGQYTGASGTLVFEATAGEEITPAIYFRRNGTGGTFKLTYFHTYLHAAIRRIA